MIVNHWKAWCNNFIVPNGKVYAFGCSSQKKQLINNLKIM